MTKNVYLILLKIAIEESKHLICALLVFFMLVCNSSIWAQVNVVSSAGSSTNATYATVNAAFAAINAATHQGTITITISSNTTEPATPTPLLASGSSGSSYSSIKIKPSGNVVINSATTPATNRGILELSGADNVTIDGDDPNTTGSQNLSIISATSGSLVVACVKISSNSTTGADGATNDTIKNCILTGSRSSATSTNTSYGIQFSNGTTTSTSAAYGNSNITIYNNIITRCYYGIYAIGNATYPNSGILISNNTIGSATSAQNVGFRGIQLTNGSTTSNPAIIKSNDIRVGDYGTTGYSATIAGIELGAGSSGSIVTSNNVHDINQPSTSGYGSYGITISNSTNTSGIKIINNFIRDVKMYVYQISNTSTYVPAGIYVNYDATNIILNHNTIVMNSQLYNSTSYSSFCVNVNSSGATFSQILNNIFINNVNSSNAYNIYISANSIISSANLNNNNYYVTGSGKIGYYSSASYATLTTWQSATGKDQLSIFENPTFTSSTDLHIPNGSNTLLESGGAATTVTAVMNDIDGQVRPGVSTYGFGTAPDIGADEFDGKAVYTCTTPNPGNTISSGNSICYGSSITLSLTNATSGTGVSYQWQTSTNNVNFTDVSGENGNTYSTTPTSVLYYRCKVKCLAGPDSTYSNPIQINFTNNLTSTTPGQRCGTGTVQLGATANSGAILNWYQNISGGSTLGSGNQFTTPSITATTTYYVGAESISTGLGTIGTGTATNSTTNYPTPYGNYYGSAHDQYLILASEMSGLGFSAGNLTSIAFNLPNGYSNASLNNYKIMMANTTNTSLTTTFISTGFTTVIPSATYTPPSTTGLATINFSTPFYWDGTSNIVVDVSFLNCTTCNGTANCTTTYSNNGVVSLTTTSFNSSHSVYDDDDCTINSFTISSGAYNDIYTKRPNITFNGQKTCSSPRVPVVATVNTAPSFSISPINTTICNNEIKQLTISSNINNYNNYTWSPSTNLYTDAAATTPYVSGNNATSVYLKSATAGQTIYTANANNTTTLCAAIATDTIIVLPNPNTLSAFALPSQFCQSGSANLTVQPSFNAGSSQFQWQYSSNNSSFSDIVGATSNTFTTPTLASTSYYRLNILNSNGTSCGTTNSDTVRIFHPSIIDSTLGTRCGPGTVTLGAIATDGTPNWFANITGGTSLGTGTTFTTPSISSTTTYYVEAQSYPSVNATIGNGTTYNATSTSTAAAYPSYYGNGRQQYLILATELSTAGFVAGNLTSLSFKTYSANGSPSTLNNYTIKLAATSLNTITTFQSPAFTTVWGASNYTPTLGNNLHTFTSPYYWDGVSNIIVDVCFSNQITGNSSAQTYFTNTGFNSTVCYYVDGTTGSGACGTTTVSSTSQNRPNITFTEDGCSSSRVPVTATIKPIPTVNLGNDTTICSGNSLILNAGNAGASYSWDNNSANQTRTINSAGTYYVTVTNSSLCSNSDTILVNVNPIPVINLNPTLQNICSGSSVNILPISNSPNTTFSWTNTSSNGVTGAAPGTGTPINQTLSNNTSAPGYSIYTITPSVGGCIGISKNDTVIVNPIPSASLNPTTQSICSGTNTLISPTSNVSGTTYSWTSTSMPFINGASNGSGLIIADNLSNTGTTTGNAVYEIIPTANGCNSASIIDTVWVQPLPNATSTNLSPTICSGTNTSINIFSNIPNAIYTWEVLANSNISGATTGSGNNISQILTNNSNTTQTIVYAITPSYNGCNGATIFDTVIVNPNQIGSLSSTSQTICSGNEIVIAPNSPQSNTTYTWTINASPSISGAFAGTGTAIQQTLTNNSNQSAQVIYSIFTEGCNGSQLLDTVTVYPKYNKSIIIDTVVCNSYTWLDNTYDYNKTFKDTFYTINGCDSAYRQINFIVDTFKIIPMLTVDSPYENEPFYFNIKSNGNEFEVLSWEPYSYFTKQNTDIQYLTLNENLFVTVTAKDKNGCYDTANQQIIVLPYKTESALPNAFSPNGDGVNDVFKPILAIKRAYKVDEFLIYNRNEQNVFRTSGTLAQGWDGTLNGKPCPIGTYYYYLKIVYLDGSEDVLKGDVTLIR